MSLRRKISAFICRYKITLYGYRTLKAFFTKGPVYTFRKIKNKLNSRKQIKNLVQHGLYDISDEQRKTQENTEFNENIKFSILVPLYNTPEQYLKEMIDSVTAQTYSNWELCLADASDDEHKNVEKICSKYIKSYPNIIYKKLSENKGIAGNTNECIKMSTGEYICLFDHDDLLHPSALFECMKAVEEGADFFYTDEGTFEDDPNNCVLIHYKPDFAIDNLRANNYICHFTGFKRELIDSVGYFSSDYDGSQDYDLILRLTEKAQKIVHIPKVMYFWRSHPASTAGNANAKPYCVTSSIKALNDHLKRCNIKGEAQLVAYPPSPYKINYEIEGQPLISIIIPNKDHIKDLKKCLTSIFQKSTYKNIEVIIVENNSEENETFEYYKSLEKYDKIKVVTWEGEFNYSAINNFAAAKANGEHILLLNNDIEVITDKWLEEMLMYSQRSDVGAVGCMLYYPNDTIQHAGVILGIGGIAGHSHKYFPRSSAGYMSRLHYAQNLSACTAACLMMKKSVFDEVGGLDERFKVAFNDVDLCMKIRKAGYLIVFTPFAELYHYESISRGAEDSPEKVKRFQGEIKLFEEKWGEELLKGDPYYNPNLTLEREDFSYK